MAALGSMFILNTPSKVAVNWFRKESVNIVTFTGILATLVSITIGAALPAFILGDDASVDDVKTFLMYQAIIISVPMVALAILFRERPD